MPSQMEKGRAFRTFTFAREAVDYHELSAMFEKMNAAAAAALAKAAAEQVAAALATDAAVLVLGGDCTVELGTVAGALRGTENVGLVYIDLDTDLNTPERTHDGALDWERWRAFLRSDP